MLRKAGSEDVADGHMACGALQRNAWDKYFDWMATQQPRQAEKVPAIPKTPKKPPIAPLAPIVINKPSVPVCSPAQAAPIAPPRPEEGPGAPMKSSLSAPWQTGFPTVVGQPSQPIGSLAPPGEPASVEPAVTPEAAPQPQAAAREEPVPERQPQNKSPESTEGPGESVEGVGESVSAGDEALKCSGGRPWSQFIGALNEQEADEARVQQEKRRREERDRRLKEEWLQDREEERRKFVGSGMGRVLGMLFVAVSTGAFGSNCASV